MSNQPKVQSERLPDPLNLIAKAKKKLNPQGAVAKSPFTDVILAMRLQGINYQAIEKWLVKQGPDHRIPASTLCRNLKSLEVNLPYAEELAEKYGGRIDLDLGRELAGQIIQQRNRLDNLQRQEIKVQTEGVDGGKPNPRYLDKRIKPERELLASLIKDLHGMMKSPLEAAEEALQADQMVEVSMTEDGRAVLRDMILSGDLKLGAEEVFALPGK